MTGCLCSDPCRWNPFYDLPTLHMQESSVEQEQQLLPDRPCCRELLLPKLSVLDAPLGIWSQICCKSILQQRDPGYAFK